MVKRAGETIGFFAVRDEADVLYLQTIQLVKAARGAGVSNEGARRLYARLGYVTISEDESALMLERSR
jgi:hypothetical protein